MPDDTWQPKLDRYLDCELPTEEMRGMDAHLRECPSCASDALHRLQLKRATRNRCTFYRIVTPLQQTVQKYRRPWRFTARAGG